MSTVRILVADDDAVTRRLITHILERQGFEVLAVRNGAEALDALDTERVDLLITDRNMPSVDGMMLMKRLHASERHRGVPIIMITSSSAASDETEAQAEGATAFLTKPVGSRELTAVVARVLEGVRGRHPS